MLALPVGVNSHSIIYSITVDAVNDGFVLKIPRSHKYDYRNANFEESCKYVYNFTNPAYTNLLLTIRLLLILRKLLVFISIVACMISFPGSSLI